MIRLVTQDDERVTAEAGAWLARLQRPDVSEADGLEFDAWLAEGPANAEAYRREVTLWQEFEANAERVLAELDTEAPRALRRDRGRPTRRWIAGAGGFAVAAGLALAILPSAVQQTTAQTYVTGKGQHQRVTLADGSIVDLDAETRMTVSLSRSERKIVLADGEAIFDVTHDPKRPFTVAASDRVVRVVGTQFDVRARQGELAITVARGKVEVRPAEAAMGRLFTLTPGQRLAVGRTGVEQLAQVDPQEAFSWRAGRLVYRNQPLSEVVDDLNRQFVEPIRLSDPELGRIPITGVIVIDNQDAVIERLALMLPVRSVRSDQGLLLLRK